MVLDLVCSEATATGGGGVGIDIVVGSMVSSSGMVGHEVKVLLPASEGVPQAPEGRCPTASLSRTLCYVLHVYVYQLVIKANHGSMRLAAVYNSLILKIAE